MTPDVRHQHLIVRAEIKNPPMGQDQAVVVEDWMRKLISDIDMKIMHGPVGMYCSVEGNRGMTAFAIIETSHLAFHSWDEPETAILQLDVYTCSDLNVNDVIRALAAFAPTKVEYKFLDREHKLVLVSEQGEIKPTLLNRLFDRFFTWFLR